MTEDRQITELFAVLVDWALSAGAENVGALPGLWTGETDQWAVECNGSTTEDRQDIPPMTFRLTHKTALIGVALVNPFGGVVAGPSEGELLDHFRAAADQNRRAEHG